MEKLVMDAIEQRVLSTENVERFVGETLGKLREAPVDAVADERNRLTAVIADLDKRIRATGAQVIAGVLDQEDAVAMNAPLREQRDLAKLQLGAREAGRASRGRGRRRGLPRRRPRSLGRTSRWRSAAPRSPSSCGRWPSHPVGW